jgi:hypothetical protein
MNSYADKRKKDDVHFDYFYNDGTSFSVHKILDPDYNINITNNFVKLKA